LDYIGQPKGGEAPVFDDDEELQEVGPRCDEGSQGRRRRGVATTPVAKGAASSGSGASATGGRGPRMASGARSARSMLPAERGANIAATSGDGAARAPHGAGPRRVKALEDPGAAQFSMPCAGAPMWRGPPTPGAPMAGFFGLFQLPGGRPRCFTPALEGLAVAEEAEGSMAQGRGSSVLSDSSGK
jgi:hypothetical protein